MIFVSVGTQLPFERLIKSMDEWTRLHPGQMVFAQIGDTVYRPLFMETVRKLTPLEYLQRFEKASVVVSHAGMGTIITGLENAKPMILMPRQMSLGEHRNDHQVGTAEKFANFELINIVHTEDALHKALDARIHQARSKHTSGQVKTSPELLARLRSFVDGEV